MPSTELPLIDQINDNMIRERLADYRLKYRCESVHLVCNPNTMQKIMYEYGRVYCIAEATIIETPYGQVPIINRAYPDGEFLLV